MREPFGDAGNAMSKHDLHVRENRCNLIICLLKLIECFSDLFDCFRPRIGSLHVPTASSVVGRPNFYHVFISHRGPDTKQNFVDVLHRFLSLQNLKAFVDFGELEIGERTWPAIENAIQNAEICVVVLSPKYAESDWCLKELEKIMEKDERVILPVFYSLRKFGRRQPNRMALR